MKDNLPVCTVALPLYNMGSIAWLALESLCRQQTRHPWELIVLQEETGHDVFDPSPYRERLTEAGCVRFESVYIHQKVGLPYKWQLAGRMAHENSRVFMLHGGDDYSPPDRIEKSVEAILNGADWYHQENCLFYEITTGAMILYSGKKKTWFTNVNIAFKTEYARAIPDTDINRGVDGFLYLHCASMHGGRLSVSTRTETPMTGLCSHGRNVISIERQKHFDEPQPPFYPTSITLEQTALPDEIKQKFASMQTKPTPWEMVEKRIKKLMNEKRNASDYSEGFKAMGVKLLEYIASQKQM